MEDGDDLAELPGNEIVVEGKFKNNYWLHMISFLSKEVTFLASLVEDLDFSSTHPWYFELPCRRCLTLK
jgi:hypothetical protein